MNQIKLLPAGDRAMVVEFGALIDRTINDRVHALDQKLKEANIHGITEMIPTFRSLLISFDPSLINRQTLEEKIFQLINNQSEQHDHISVTYEIPCCYSLYFGPDLENLARSKNLAREELIDLHSSVPYHIYMLGFLPGFVYLGGLDPKLEAPRLKTPRLKIPRGSVGIGGIQTGVYPLESPGGWQLIGRTPIDFYDPNRDEPVLCKAGDQIRFVPITSCEYYDIRREIISGNYQINQYPSTQEESR